MTTVDTRTLDFHTEQLTGIIKEKYGFNEQQALEKFLFSETYQMLLNPQTALYRESPYFLLDMWEAEQITGNPRNSFYIKGEH